jgi:uracil-DNA glycosylase family 4
VTGKNPNSATAEIQDTNSLSAIEAVVRDCRACPRLVAHRERIGKTKRRAYMDEDYWARAVSSFGDPHGRLLIVGLAPAAHGANRTGRMFTGDSSGDWLYRALHRAGFANRPESVSRRDGLALENAYITAVAHCAPPDNKPTTEEVAQCAPFLEAELRIFESRARPRSPAVILALGGIAFSATLRMLEKNGVKIPRPRPKFGHATRVALTESIHLVTSYHPSRQNTHTKRLTEPMFDDVFAICKKLLG